MITTDFGILSDRRFDVCVVGSGPVGSCLAIDLAYRGLSVLVLESGLSKSDRRFQSLSDAQIASPQYHHSMSVAVGRSLGGTSQLWGGRCVPLDQIDFMKRSFVANSGWPITYDDVSLHERRAAELLGCDDGDFTTDDLTNFGGADIDFGRLERWVNETNIVRQHPELKSSDRITILLGATVIGLNIEAGANVIKAVRVAREGPATEFSGASNFVLALGGIETARLLLNVQSEHPQLFGGASGPLGRYYMGHISGSFADVRFYDPVQIVNFLNFSGKRSFARRRLTLSAAAQLSNQLPNMAFWPENTTLSDSNHKSGFLSLAFLLLRIPNLSPHFVARAIVAMQTNHRAKNWPHLKNLIRDLDGAVAGITEVIKQRVWYGRRLPRFLVENASGIYPLRFHSEQAPHLANRIRLTGERDRLGLGRVMVEFAFSPPELALVRKAHQVLDRSLKELRLGELIYHEDSRGGDALPRTVPDGLHQIGLTRMADSASTGVVNRDCRVFEFENLYIAGSSVFPTSGQASPTLPSVAVALRLSEHLAHRLLANDVRCLTGPRPDTRRMSILFVTASYYPAVRYGGPIYTVHSLARTLAERGNRVVVYTTNIDGDQTSDVSTPYMRVIDGVTVHYFPAAIERIYWSPAMNRSLRENVVHFDVVHAQGAFLYPTVAARNAASLSGVPFVYSPRGMLVDTLIRMKNFVAKSVWLKAFEVANCRRAAFVHATSNIEAQEIKRLGLRPYSVEVIPNGVHMPEQETGDSDELRRSRLLGSRQPYIIILGRVTWKKGLDRLIQAMSFVPEVNLVIAGNDDENYTPQLVSLAQERGLQDRVIFTGGVYGADKFALLRGAKLFVLPSYSESFGVVLLEALCCGCPVMMTPEVGIAKDIERMGAGITVRGLPAEMGQAICSLLADPDRRRKMGDRGRRAATEIYSWDATADQMEAAYRRACWQKSESA